MEKRFVVNCPKCNSSYRVRYSVLGREAKCVNCELTFILKVPEYHEETEIMDWLANPASKPLDATVAGLKVVDIKSEAPVSKEAKSPVDVKREDQLNIYKVDPTCAYFWFSAKLLSRPEFRASFPQRCAKTLTRRGLNIYLLSWTQGSIDEHDKDDRTEYRPVAKLDELPKVKPVELLSYLPERDDQAEPFCMPFPFYVAKGVSPAGLVRTSVSGRGNDQRCWISIANLDIAAKFFANSRGTDDPEYNKLRVHKNLRKKDRWKSLSGSVQERILEWYKPTDGEKFVAYLPDDDAAKSDIGACGLVLTDRRLIYHKAQTWREYPLGEPITIRTQAGKVEMYSSIHGRAVLQLSGKSWANLKHFLKALEASVKFVG